MADGELLTTEFCVKGDKEALDRLYDFMKDYASEGNNFESHTRFPQFYAALGEESHVPVTDDGCDWRDDNRNLIYGFKRTDDGVEFETETWARSSIDRFCEVLRRHFPGIRVLSFTENLHDFRSENFEPGWTNDVDDERFHDNWFVSIRDFTDWQIGSGYFVTVEEMLTCVNSYLGIELDVTAYSGMIDCAEINERLKKDFEGLGREETCEVSRVTRAKDV